MVGQWWEQEVTAQAGHGLCEALFTEYPHDISLNPPSYLWGLCSYDAHFRDEEIEVQKGSHSPVEQGHGWRRNDITQIPSGAWAIGHLVRGPLNPFYCIFNWCTIIVSINGLQLISRCMYTMCKVQIRVINTFVSFLKEGASIFLLGTSLSLCNWGDWRANLELPLYAWNSMHLKNTAKL